MPFYHKLGDIPNKRHTVFKSESGKHRYEELFEQLDLWNVLLVYHTKTNTSKEVLKKIVQPEIAVENIKSRL